MLDIQDHHYNSVVQDHHDSSSDEEIVQQDAQFDYYTMPTTNSDAELAGRDTCVNSQWIQPQ